MTFDMHVITKSILVSFDIRFALLRNPLLIFLNTSDFGHHTSFHDSGNRDIKNGAWMGLIAYISAPERLLFLFLYS
jgi:hypothetical protein